MSVKWNQSIELTLTNCEGHPGKGFFPLTLGVTPDSIIVYHDTDQKFQVTIKHELGYEIKSKVPEFVKIEENTSQRYKFELPDDYRPHLVFFLTTWGENSVGKGFGESFKDAFESWCKRFEGKEPVSLKDQKGIIGELFTLEQIHPNYGLDAIQCWSRKDLIDFSLESTHDVVIEVKTAGEKKGSLVTISHLEQLEFHSNSPRMILSVVKIKSSVGTAGKFLYEWLEESIDNLEKKAKTKPALNAHVNLLKSKIQAAYEGSLSDLDKRKKFFTKHEIIGIDWYEVEENDSADKMAKGVGTPNGVKLSKYKIDPTVLKSVSFP
jgi:hypothetical protein